MAKFRRKSENRSQSINTASLPDIVFMLLFFFMVVTRMKDTEIRVQVSVPKASEAGILENKQVLAYMYIGKPKQSEIYGTDTRIQLNDAFRDPASIPLWVEEEKKRIPSNMSELFTVSIRADKDVKMGVLNDVKSKLREANALKIVYSANTGRSLSDLR